MMLSLLKERFRIESLGHTVSKTLDFTKSDFFHEVTQYAFSFNIIEAHSSSRENFKVKE